MVSRCLREHILNILITGGSGFIGSALVRFLLDNTSHQVINLDKLTYAVHPDALVCYTQHPRYTFIQGDICDGELVETLFEQHQPDWIVHLAAESHVDKSIYASRDFIQTNIVGAYQLLEQALSYWYTLEKTKQRNFRFLHVSTDEVFGDLQVGEAAFNEDSPYKPAVLIPRPRHPPITSSELGPEHTAYRY